MIYHTSKARQEILGLDIAVVRHTSIKDKEKLHNLLLDFIAYEDYHGTGKKRGFIHKLYGTEYYPNRLDIKEETRWFPINVHLEHKDFMRRQIDGKWTMLQGLTTPQEWVKNRWKTLGSGAYDVVIFMYERRPEQHGVTSWTRHGDIAHGTQFIEIPLLPDWQPKEALRLLTHEIRHVYVKRINQLVAYYKSIGITYPACSDVMDLTPVLRNGKIDHIPYYHEYDIYAEDGNRAVQDRILHNHPLWEEMVYRLPMKEKTFWQRLREFLTLAFEENPGDEPQEREPVGVEKWADAIQKHEGWFVGSCSYRGNNPANARWANQPTAIGTHKCGAKGAETEYALFPDYKTGRKYLEDLLTSHATGKSSLYARKAKELFDKNSSSELTIHEHLQIYAPSADSNNPKQYAEFVANHLGVTINTKIGKLV